MLDEHHVNRCYTSQTCEETVAGFLGRVGSANAVESDTYATCQPQKALHLSSHPHRNGCRVIMGVWEKAHFTTAEVGNKREAVQKRPELLRPG